MMTIIQILSHYFKQNTGYSFGYSAVKLSPKKPIWTSAFSELSPVPSVSFVHTQTHENYTTGAAGTPAGMQNPTGSTPQQRT